MSRRSARIPDVTGGRTAKWREAHLKELLAEMERQARLLKSPLEE